MLAIAKFIIVMPLEECCLFSGEGVGSNAIVSLRTSLQLDTSRVGTAHEPNLDGAAVSVD